MLKKSSFDHNFKDVPRKHLCHSCHSGCACHVLWSVLQDTQPGGGRKSILGNELNYFRQLYVETTGKPGDLRVSEVYAGDPAVKGSIFVHQRA